MKVFFVRVLLFFIVFYGFITNAQSSNLEQEYEQVSYVKEFLKQHGYGDVLHIKKIGQDISVIDANRFDVDEVDRHYPLTSFDIDGKTRLMFDFYDDDNFIIVNEGGNVIFLQLKIMGFNADRLFESLSDLQYLSLVVDGFNTSVDISKNKRLKEVFLKGGYINDLILPNDNSSIESIGTVRGVFNKLSNLSSQDELFFLRANSSVINIDDINNSESIKRLVLYPHDKSPDGLKVSSLVNLEYLAFHDDFENDISNLGELRKIKSLLMYDMSADDLQLPESLEFLSIGSRKTTRLPFIPSNNNLVEMKISNTLIKEVVISDNLNDLKSLSIDSMPLNNIIGLSKLTSLTELTIENTNLESIDGLAGLNYLKRVNLSRNMIKTVGDLFYKKSCELIDLSFNEIEKMNIKELNEIEDCHVFFIGNPFSMSASKILKNKLYNLERKGKFNIK